MGLNRIFLTRWIKTKGGGINNGLFLFSVPNQEKNIVQAPIPLKEAAKNKSK